MKHFLKTLINSSLLLFFVLFQAISPVKAYNLQGSEDDISVNITVDNASIVVGNVTKLRITITNGYAAEINVIQGSFTLPDGLEFSSDQATSCPSGGSLTVSKDSGHLYIDNGTMRQQENCFLVIDIKGVQVNNYSISINAGDITAAPFVFNDPRLKNSSWSSTSLSVLDINGYTATPTLTPTDSATSTPIATNTPLPTNTATNTPLPTNTATNTPLPTNTVTAHPTNTPAATSGFTSTPQPSTPIEKNPSVVPTRTKEPTIVALVSVVTPTITERTTLSLTATTTTPTIIATTTSLPVQTTDSVPDAPSTQGNLPISLLLGGGLLLLGAVGYGIYSLIKK